MFLATDEALLMTGGTAVRPQGVTFPPARTTVWARWRQAARDTDWVPDLGARIGSRDWWRGLVTCSALCAATIAMAPRLERPILGAAPEPLTGEAWANARAQAIAPIALGADSGRRMAAGDLVTHLAEAPERPMVELSATVGSGDRLARVLQRAGVSRDQARDAAELVEQAAGARPSRRAPVSH
ncbi:hypothetical protein P0F65_16355 [Sphingomonas sp. I4]